MLSQQKQHALRLRLVHLLLGLSRKNKQTLQAIVDLFSIIAAILLALMLSQQLSVLTSNQIITTALALSACSLIISASLGLYNNLIRFASFQVIRSLSLSCLITSVFLYLILTSISSTSSIHITIGFGAFAILLQSGWRFFTRSYLNIPRYPNQGKPIAIYGAGVAGAITLQALQQAKRFNVKFLIDDDHSLIGQSVHGVRIISFDESLIALPESDVDTVVIAIPSAEKNTMAELTARLRSHQINVKTLPTMEELITGASSFSDLRDIPLRIC